MATKKIKHRYLQSLGIIIMVLALVRCIFISEDKNPQGGVVAEETKNDTLNLPPSTLRSTEGRLLPTGRKNPQPSILNPPHSTLNTPHSTLNIPKKRKGRFIDYAVEFNDSNHVQLVAAQQWGVSPVKDREDAEQRKSELVYMASSPYYDLAHLDSSIPYLVPHAAILLEDIGRAFIDSLQARRMPLYSMVVSSVLRSEDDVARLRRSNKNATERSCHLYSTTFDINYTVFKPVTTSREVDAETEVKLKAILGEVLYDLRCQDRCYVKYERIQPCFHITVR